MPAGGPGMEIRRWISERFLWCPDAPGLKGFLGFHQSVHTSQSMLGRLGGTDVV